MKIIEDTVKAAGKSLTDPELYLKIENPPYMPLTIEAIGKGPRGYPAISVCHYGEQNGDLMRDPEMCFEIAENLLTHEWHYFAYYWRNDYAGVEEESIVIIDGVAHVRPTRLRQHQQFAAVWNKNLKAQGFVEAAKRQCATG